MRDFMSILFYYLVGVVLIVIGGVKILGGPLC